MSKSATTALGAFAMIALVIAARFTTQIVLVGTVTWGPFTITLTFLVTMLVTHFAGRREAVVIGVVGAAVLTAVLAQAGVPGRALVAAFIAFALGQVVSAVLVDVLREKGPYLSALIAGAVAGALNGATFQTLAWAGTERPWISGALTDAAIKVAIAFVIALAFRIIVTSAGRTESTPAHRGLA